MLPVQAALVMKNPFTKSKISMLRVVKGMMESKKTNDTDKDSVTQSSLTNLFTEATNR